MKKSLTLFGVLCLLLAFVIPIFLGPMTVMEAPFWDSMPHSTSNPIIGGDPGENPIRVNHWSPLESFIVDGTYELNRIEVYAQMCNYLPDELSAMDFPDTELRATLYNWTPADGGDYKLPGDRSMANFHYDITGIMRDSRYITLTGSASGLRPTVSSDPTTTYSIAFSLLGHGADYYDICIFRSLHDVLDGRGYVWPWDADGGAENWLVMPGAEGQDVAMRLYGNEIAPPEDPNDNDGDGIPDDEDDDDDNDGIPDDKDESPFIPDEDDDTQPDRIPLITAFLFALGGILLLLGMGTPLSGWGWLIILILFVILFAVWYFWLIWAWLGVFV